jgi:hypothetical protein
MPDASLANKKNTVATTTAKDSDHWLLHRTDIVLSIKSMAINVQSPHQSSRWR